MSATVVGDYAISPASVSSLLTGLVAFWKLEEASGTRVDSAGNNDLSDNNTVTQATGKIGYAAEFVGTNNEYLSISDNPVLSMGDIDFTISLWANYTTVNNNALVGKYYYYDNNREYYINIPGTKFQFVISPNGIDEVSVVNTDGPSVSSGNWYFIVAWHDSINNTLNIQVNNGTINSTGHSGGVFNGNSTFCLGTLLVGGGCIDGLLDATGIWKRVLTADERSSLYNSGSGREYPFS